MQLTDQAGAKLRCNREGAHFSHVDRYDPKKNQILGLWTSVRSKSPFGGVTPHFAV